MCNLSPNSNLATIIFIIFLSLQIISEELIRAAALGNEAKVDTILKAGAVHVDVVDKLGHSALLAAAVRH